MAVVWGTQYIETARTLLYARLTELVTQMSTGYDPTFVEAFDHHLVSAILPNAITLGLERADEIDGSSAIGTTGILAEHRMVFSIRVHTDYVGGWQDEMKQARLLESVENKLHAKLVLTSALQPRSQIYISAVGTILIGQSFEDTNTIGGSITGAVTSVVEHTQE